MKEIVVTINKKTGDTTVEARGFKGKACLAATAAIEEALGKTAKSEPTSEMQEREGEHVRQRR